MRVLFVVILLGGGSLNAQHFSQLGRYSIAYAQGCTPVTVTVTTHDDFVNTTRQYEYESGMTPTLSTTWTFDSPGTYKIIQYVGVDGVPKSDTLVFQVVAAPAPSYEVVHCSDTEVSFQVDDTYYDYLTIQTSDGRLITTDGLVGAYTHNYGVSQGMATVRGHLEGGFNTCGQVEEEILLNSLEEASLSEVELLERCQDSYFLTFRPDRFQQDVRYEVTLSGNGLTENIYRGTLTDSSYTTKLIGSIADASYCIQVATMNHCTGVAVATMEACDIRPLLVDSIGVAYASYAGRNIFLYFDSLQASSMMVYRTTEGVSPSVSVPTHPYIDRVPSVFRQYSYEMTKLDSCGNEIDQFVARAPFLKLVDKDREKNTVTTRLSVPENTFDPIVPELLWYSEDSALVIITAYAIEQSIPSGLGEKVYVRAYYDYGGVEVTSNALEVEYEARVFVPGAFTPNGDGVNDQLELFGLPVPDGEPGPVFTLLIFDRWGKLIHQSSENPAWDGRVRKHTVPLGTYIYRLAFTLPTGKVKTQQGTFTVVN